MLFKGTIMKSGFFARKDEVVLSAFTAFIVAGLLYQAVASLSNGKEHSVFQKSHVIIKK